MLTRSFCSTAVALALSRGCTTKKRKHFQRNEFVVSMSRFFSMLLLFFAVSFQHQTHAAPLAISTRQLQLLESTCAVHFTELIRNLSVAVNSIHSYSEWGPGIGVARFHESRQVAASVQCSTGFCHVQIASNWVWKAGKRKLLLDAGNALIAQLAPSNAGDSSALQQAHSNSLSDTWGLFHIAGSADACNETSQIAPSSSREIKNATMLDMVVLSLDASWPSSGSTAEEEASVSTAQISCAAPSALFRRLQRNQTNSALPQCGNTIIIFSVQLALAAVGSEHAAMVHQVWLYIGHAWREVPVKAHPITASTAWGLPISIQGALQKANRCSGSVQQLQPSLVDHIGLGNQSLLYTTLSLPAIELLGGHSVAARIAGLPLSTPVTIWLNEAPLQCRVWGGWGLKGTGLSPRQRLLRSRR